MQKTFNECVGCVRLGLHCIGKHCPNLNVKRFFCDNCDTEISAGEIYIYDGQELCEDCLKDTCRMEL